MAQSLLVLEITTLSFQSWATLLASQNHGQGNAIRASKPRTGQRCWCVKTKDRATLLEPQNQRQGNAVRALEELYHEGCLWPYLYHEGCLWPYLYHDGCLWPYLYHDGCLKTKDRATLLVHQNQRQGNVRTRNRATSEPGTGQSQNQGPGNVRTKDRATSEPRTGQRQNQGQSVEERLKETQREDHLQKLLLQ